MEKDRVNENNDELYIHNVLRKIFRVTLASGSIKRRCAASVWLLRYDVDDVVVVFAVLLCIVLQGIDIY